MRILDWLNPNKEFNDLMDSVKTKGITAAKDGWELWDNPYAMSPYIDEYIQWQIGWCAGKQIKGD